MSRFSIRYCLKTLFNLCLVLSLFFLAACQSSLATSKVADPIAVSTPIVKESTEVATSGNTCNGSVVPPTIVGNYVDNYGGKHKITPDKWIIGPGSPNPLIFTYCTVDNPSEKLVAQNAATNLYNPNLFSQFDWTTYNNSLWYCQIVFNAQTEGDAAAAPPADPSNPPVGGCAQFPWSQLIPVNNN